jgi:hypothetical protein
MVWFGLISFSLYLWHWPIFAFAKVIYQDDLPRNFEFIALMVAVVLAWATTRFVERPFRFSSAAVALKGLAITFTLIITGLGGLALSRIDLTQSHVIGNLMVPRNESFAIGGSNKYYRGQGDWLFLGNAYNDTVAKLKLSVMPSPDDIDQAEAVFTDLATVAAKSNTKVVLLVGPNKSSVYSEYLPTDLKPSPTRYIEFFLERLRPIPNLTVYDPTRDLISVKNHEGILYWRTDTHWNQKGAYFALNGALDSIDVNPLSLSFRNSGTHGGDLIEISGLTDLPLQGGDNWEVIWPQEATWKVKSGGGQSGTFGSIEVIENLKPVAPLTAWVVGDSFTSALRPYFNFTFGEVNYIGHWSEELETLSDNLATAENKPDIIFVVRVERSF